jgi:hypothetical protein
LVLQLTKGSPLPLGASINFLFIYIYIEQKEGNNGLAVLNNGHRKEHDCYNNLKL